jgi:hypothetical protein
MENKESTDLDTRSYLMGFCEAIYRKNDQKCKWTKYINLSYPSDWEEQPKMYFQSCDKKNVLSRKQDDFVFCPYCGKPIEGIE